MRICLLGTAAGGGVPQWNCNCPLCGEARSPTGRVQARTQSCIAITSNNEKWFLLNASPDLRIQIERFAPLHPQAGTLRSSPIQSVLLTNADLDHTLGLFLLREGESLHVHASNSVQRSLRDGMSLDSTLTNFCGIDWKTLPSSLSPLLNRDGSETGLLYEPILLRGHAPRFIRSGQAAFDHVVGYRFVDERTAGRLLFLPDVPAMSETVKRALPDCDVLLFDGTFWSDDEMMRQGVGKLTASSMGHVPISGPEGSLEILRGLSVNRKIYIHINNTNPILVEDSPERTTVEAAGCSVGQDGMDMTI